MPPAWFPLLRKVDAEIDTGSAAYCRICLEFGSGPGHELISPCMCKGTQQFVHRSCLDHWRSVREGIAFSHCTTCTAQFHLRVQFLERSRCRQLKFRLFVARDILLVFLAIQASIAAMGSFAYLLDKDGKFINNFADWNHFLSKHPIPFYYCVGLVVFFALVGFFGCIMHWLMCPSTNNNYSSSTGSSNWDIESTGKTEDCFSLLVIFVIIFAALGLVYGFVAASKALQKIWQRHYHILTKKELTKEYVVEDLRGGYTQPKMNPEHEQRLKMLHLM